jgi:hypothetical protein
MKYQEPWGVTTPTGDAPYANGNPAIGLQGSIPPAASIEYPMREITNLISDSGQTPTDADLHQVTRAIRDGKLNFCVDSGPLNQLQVTPQGPPLQTLNAGLTLRVLVAHTNTGPVRITVGTLNSTSVKRRDGAELSANDIVAGQVATLTCDGSVFQLISGAGTGAPPSATIYQVNIPYVHDTGSPNHVVANYSPVLADINEGRVVLVKLANNTTGATDFAPNNFPIHPIVHPDGSPIIGGDGLINEIWMLCFDGVNWQLISATCCGSTVPAAAVTPTGKSLQFYYGGGFPGPLNTMSHLRWTPPLNSNRQVWSWSAFIRRPVASVIPDSTTAYSNGNGIEVWFSAGGAQAGGDYTGMEYYGSQWGNAMNLFWNNSSSCVAGNSFYANGGGNLGFSTAPILMDTKWHHCLMNSDGAHITFKVDGIMVSQGTASGNGAINAARPHEIGADADDLGSWYGATCRMAEVIFIDGHCLDWTSFASNVGGVMIPKPITGLVFGPNGFYLNWNDSSAVTATTLGKDWSGNANNFTPYNFSTSAVLADYPGLGVQV